MTRRTVERRLPGADEDALGRAYDRRLMARLWAYARAYRGVLAASALLFPVAAAVDLVQPYLVKVAIDDHIVHGDWPGLSRVVGLFVITLLVQYVLRYALDLIIRNITEGVQYGEEAYYFGQAGASSEFRQSIARFRNRSPLPRPPRRPTPERERVRIRQLADESLAASRERAGER